jgi:hypothetical protein
MRAILWCLALAAPLAGSACHNQSAEVARLDAGSLRTGRGTAPARGPFAWNDYLTRVQQYNTDFVRLWVWEQPKGLTTAPARPRLAEMPSITSGDQHRDRHFASLVCRRSRV